MKLNSELAATTQRRALGVIIDHSLKFSVQCAAVAKKANEALGFIGAEVALCCSLQPRRTELEKVQRKATVMSKQLLCEGRMKRLGLQCGEEKHKGLAKVYKIMKAVGKTKSGCE